MDGDLLCLTVIRIRPSSKDDDGGFDMITMIINYANMRLTHEYSLNSATLDPRIFNCKIKYIYVSS